jgi:hypothetical protein
MQQNLENHLRHLLSTALIHQLQIHHTSFFHFSVIFRKQECTILKNLNTNKKSAKHTY